MGILAFVIFLLLAAVFFVLFIKKTGKFEPLWLMLSAWMLAIGVPRLHLSTLELVWPTSFWGLVIVSLISFILGFYFFSYLFSKYPFWQEFKVFKKDSLSTSMLRWVIYFLFAVSLIALKMFYDRTGNFPALSANPDVFRFTDDKTSPGLVNYLAQLARMYVPLAFFLIFWQKFSLKKHWDLIIIILAGTFSLLLFASRTQIYMIDLWVMALYLFIRRPNIKQALKFYPLFLIISVVVLAAIPLYRQARSYQPDYLQNITQIDSSHYFKGASYLLPIYVGISFNMQALLHADHYYLTHPFQHGKVSLDIFTHLLRLHQFKSNYDLGAIFESWWNTGTYLFPFVQDFGRSAFYFVPFLVAGFLTLAWRFFVDRPKNFLALNLYAYACFFITMTIYLSFTIRAEMYIDLFLLVIIYLAVSRKERKIT